MTDAYEIGIKLALDDGVSAGLAVISREVAEINQAIASANAGFIRLGHAGIGAGTVLPTSFGETQVQSRSETAGAAGSHMSAEERHTIVEVETSPGVPPSKGSDGFQLGHERVDSADHSSVPVVGSVAQTAVEQRQEIPLAGWRGPEPTSLAPVPAATPDIAQVGAKSEINPGPPTGSPYLDNVITLPSQSPVQSPAVGNPASSNKAPASVSPSAPSSSVAATLAVSRSHRQVQAPGANPRAIVHPMSVAGYPSGAHATSEAMPSAPAQSRAVVQSASAEGRSVAPRSSGKEDLISLSGTVVLDGRVVGQWMAEQFAQQASRPPSGTTFFDPRQGHAWNSSGVL